MVRYNENEPQYTVTGTPINVVPTQQPFQEEAAPITQTAPLEQLAQAEQEHNMINLLPEFQREEAQKFNFKEQEELNELLKLLQEYTHAVVEIGDKVTGRESVREMSEAFKNAYIRCCKEIGNMPASMPKVEG